MKIILIQLYEYFVTKVYSEGYQFFELKTTKAHRKVLVDFLVELSKKIDLELVDFNYLFDYVGFTFEYILIKRPNYNSRRIPVNQIFSQTAFQVWEDRSEGYEYYVGQSLYGRGVRREDFVPDKYHLISIVELREEEEEFKRRYIHRAEAMLGLCIESTTLFNHKSQYCQICKDKHVCKVLLERSSSGVYYDRGYYT